jgi:hypothetical protein
MVYFLQEKIVNPMLNLLKRSMTYPGFEPGIFGVQQTAYLTTAPFSSSALTYVLLFLMYYYTQTNKNLLISTSN